MRRLLLLTCLSLAAFGAKAKYEYTRAGSAANAVRTTTDGIMLIGGGADVNAAFQQLCAWGGNGDILVIRASGTAAYNPYITGLCPSANSVATLVVPAAAGANDPAVATIINDAEAIFIAGGDQGVYVSQWTGTGLQTALNHARFLGRPIGGTSAGMMVLSEFVYSALLSKGVTSSQALANPYSQYLTIARDFVDIPLLQGAISDSHFRARDRMGRNLAFLCRVYAAGGPNDPRSIAIDEATALLIDPSGVSAVVGVGAVYFLRAPGPPSTCAAGVPLTYSNVGVRRVNNGGSFNVATWTGAAGAVYTVSATSGVLSSTQAGGAIY